MFNIRRAGFIFLVLIIGIMLGSLGTKTAMLIVTPLFIFWFMLLDEKSYRRHEYRQQSYQREEQSYHHSR